MMNLRPAQERGLVRLNWLTSHHSFSFGHYYDPNHMGFAHLRVINEDTIAPGQGFPTHGHRDMEILTYVLAGKLQHQDSIGNGSMMGYGDVQRMSAGTGIMHSEFNASDREPVHLLQIWILPKQRGLAPSYEQRTFTPAEKEGQLRLIGSATGRNGSVTIHQEVDLYASRLAPGAVVSHSLGPDRVAWVQVAQGEIQLNGQKLFAGDGAAIQELPQLHLQGVGPSNELLLFDMGLAS